MDVFIRPAKLQDKNLLFKWVNSNDSIKFKIKTNKKINFIDHEAWLIERLKDKDTYIWIIEDKNIPIGQIRFQHSRDNYYDVDIFVVDKVRKTGLASKALMKAEKKTNIKPLRAVVKKNNHLSYSFFIRNSYSLFSENAEFWILIK